MKKAHVLSIILIAATLAAPIATSGFATATANASCGRNLDDEWFAYSSAYAKATLPASQPGTVSATVHIETRQPRDDTGFFPDGIAEISDSWDTHPAQEGSTITAFARALATQAEIFSEQEWRAEDTDSAPCQDPTISRNGEWLCNPSDQSNVWFANVPHDVATEAFNTGTPLSSLVC